MRSFHRFLEDQGFQADACKALEDPDFYALAEAMHRALEIIADPGTATQTHHGTIQALRAHAWNAIHPIPPFKGIEYERI